jgi:molybdopterin synthase sulfur carrier subunit
MAYSLHIVYFAWVKERIGLGEETLNIPKNVNSVAELLNNLIDLDSSYQHAFSEPQKLRFALDQEFVQIDALLADRQELAIFPPVTGG